MRKFPLTVTALTAALLFGGIVPALGQDRSLTINSFGGAYETAHRKCVITPFEKETGASVKVVTAYSADGFAQLRAQKAAPQYDVMHFSGGQEIVAAAEGLLSPIDPSRAPNLADVYPVAKAGIAKGEGPVYSIAAIGLVYNSQIMQKAPTTWKDLLDPRQAGKLVLTDISNGYGMLGFLMINRVAGGDLRNIQPGLDEVRKLLAAGAVVVKTSPEIQREFTQNGAGIAPYASDYAFTLTKANLPVKFAQGAEGTPASFITANLVANRPNQALALRFIDMSLSESAQVCFANELRYTPTNAKARLTPEVAATVAYGQAAMQNLFRFDAPTIEANRANWVERWNKAIAR